MRRLLYGLALGACVLASTANAAWVTVGNWSAGQWRVQERFDPATGVSACSMETYWNSGRTLAVMALSSPRSLSLVVNDPQLPLRQGLSGQGTIDIDGERFYARFETAGAGVAIATITDRQAGTRFLTYVAAGNDMTVALPWGQSFQAGLSGTTQAVTMLGACVTRM